MACLQSSGASSGPWATVSVLVGAYVMVASHGVSTYWGNLSVYVISFIHFRVGEDVKDSATWVMALNFLGWNIGLLLCERINNALGPRVTVAVNALLMAASSCLSFLSVQHSFGALLLSYPLLLGLSHGLGHGLQLMLVPAWVASEYQGIACCSIFSVMQFGSLLMNLVITWYINPENFSPEVGITEETLFSRPELLDRVPYMFLLHGAIALTLFAISFTLIREKPKLTKEEKEKKVNDDRMSNDNSVDYENIDDNLSSDVRNIETQAVQRPTNVEKSKCYNSSSEEFNDPYNLSKERSTAIPILDPLRKGQSSSHTYFGPRLIKKDCERTQLTESIAKHNNQYLEATGGNLQQVSDNIVKLHDNSKLEASDKNQGNHLKDRATAQTNSGPLEAETGSHSGDVTSNLEDVKPKQAVRRKEFYALFVMTFCADTSFVTFGTYYKIFGMLLYPDDHFFANVSVAATIGILVMTTLVGLACDRFGVKNTLIAVSSSICVVVAFFYTSLLVNQWIYSACVIMLIGLVLIQYNMAAVCCVCYFGKSHSSTISGMAMSATYVSGAGIPFFVQYMLSTYGWFTLFSSMNLFVMLHLLTVIIGLPAVSRFQ